MIIPGDTLSGDAFLQPFVRIWEIFRKKIFSY